MRGPKQNLGHISSAFLTFIWYKQTDRIIIQYFNFWNSQVAIGKWIPPKKLANYRNSSNLSFFCADRSFAHCKLHFLHTLQTWILDSILAKLSAKIIIQIYDPWKFKEKCCLVSLKTLDGTDITGSPIRPW